MAASSGDVVAFLDDDAVALEDWLERLAECYADDEVVIAGGFIEPAWDDDGHRVPERVLWVVGCSYEGPRRADRRCAT